MTENKQDAENSPEKKYSTIGEVARELEVNPSLIRYWEKHFSQINPKKNRKGHRLFTAKDIEALKFIHFLVKEKGHSIENAQHVIQNRHKVANQEYEMAETLKRTKTFLLDLKKYLDTNE